MASQLCHGGTAIASEMPADCHDSDSADTDPEPPCPGSDVVPDLGKLPTFAPLPTGQDFAAIVALHVPALRLTHRSVGARDGPHLDALCRLLI